MIVDEANEDLEMAEDPFLDEELPRFDLKEDGRQEEGNKNGEARTNNIVTNTSKVTFEIVDIKS